MRGLVVLLILIGLSGCATSDEKELTHVSYAKLLENNRSRIAKIRPGMSREMVVESMGTYTSRVRNGELSNPWLAEFEVDGSTTNEVMYYLVHPHPPFTPILKRQATAVVLKNGAVVGMKNGAEVSIETPGSFSGSEE